MKLPFIINKVTTEDSSTVKQRRIVFQTNPWWWLSYEIVYGYTSNYKQLIFMKRKWMGIGRHWVKCNTKYNTKTLQWEWK